MSDRGDNFERKVRKQREAEGWFVARAAGSLGDADLVLLRSARIQASDGFDLNLCQAQLVECKTTAAGPYADFGPSDRQELIAAARRAGASAWLAWRPPYARQTKWIHESAWPDRTRTGE